MTETPITDVQQTVGQAGLKLRLQGNAEKCRFSLAFRYIKPHSMNKSFERDKLQRKTEHKDWGQTVI